MTQESEINAIAATDLVESSLDITWLGTADAAERLGVTVRTLYRLIDSGELPAYRFGRVIRLKEDDIARYIVACRIQPGTLEHLYPDTSAKVKVATTS